MALPLGKEADGDRSGGNRRPSTVDAEVGKKIKTIRTELRMSQEMLAERLGISSQQLQKYESGTNRISVSRLVDLARELETPVTDLLANSDDICAHSRHEPLYRSVQVPTADETKELLISFWSIKNAEARAKIVDMAKFFSAMDAVKSEAR